MLSGAFIIRRSKEMIPYQEEEVKDKCVWLCNLSNGRNHRLHSIGKSYRKQKTGVWQGQLLGQYLWVHKKGQFLTCKCRRWLSWEQGGEKTKCGDVGGWWWLAVEVRAEVCESLSCLLQFSQRSTKQGDQLRVRREKGKELAKERRCEIPFRTALLLWCVWTGLLICDEIMKPLRVTMPKIVW